MNEYARWKSDIALQYLNEIRQTQNTVKRLQDEIEVQRSLLQPSAIDYAKDNVSHTSATDALENGSIKLLEMISSYADELQAYVYIVDEAHNCIANLDDERHRGVLTEYYLLGREWSDVGNALNYSPDYCREIRTEALPLFYDVMPTSRKVKLPRADE